MVWRDEFFTKGDDLVLRRWADLNGKRQYYEIRLNRNNILTGERVLVSELESKINEFTSI